MKDPDLSVYNECIMAPVPPNTAPFTTEEVARKLKGSESTAPGPDRLAYNHLRSFDQEAKVRTIIYNICLKAGRIPDSWKISRTIFNPKGGEPNDASNWRPISLSSTIYKLFSCLIAKRLSDWIEDYSVISNRQKGYRPFDGTLENNFLLDQKIKHSRRKKRDVFVILIDMKNAFGSIPQEAVIAALEKYGAGSNLTNLIKQMDEGAKTQLLNLQGLSDPLDIKIGVKQGDPLSGYKFILGINPIFDIIQNNRRALHCLGYVDDIDIIEDSEEDMMATIQQVVEFTRKLGLELNPLKCKAIHINSKAKCVPTEFVIENTPVPSLNEFEPSKYLGKPFGFNIFENTNEIEKLIETGSRILESELAPWQKIDALK